MLIQISFVNSEGNPTDDFVRGWPAVWVNIEVGFRPPADPSQVFDANFVRVLALLDTGGDHTVIAPALAIGIPPDRRVASHSMLGHGYSDVYPALIEIIGFPSPHYIEVGVAPLKSMRMSLGRDIISKYRFVYDTPGRIFTLERT